MIQCDYCKQYVEKTYTIDLFHKDDFGRTGSVLSGICENCINELKLNEYEIKIESLVTEFGVLAYHRKYVERYGK